MAQQIQRLTTSNKYETAIFVSYAWGGESERMVDELEQAFVESGIRIVRDKKELGYKGSIETFEQRIGHGQCIVLVISDKYLRSEHCMYELVEADRNQNLRDRIFPIVLADAQIYKAIDRLNYIKHWDKEIEQLNQAIKDVKVMSNLPNIMADLDKYTSIRASVDHLTDLLSDMNTLTPKAHAANGFSTLLDAVEHAMIENKIILTKSDSMATSDQIPKDKPNQLQKTAHLSVMKPSDRKLSVFLCHASQDKPIVRELYQKLHSEGWIDPWLDKEKLRPGQSWRYETEKALNASDVVCVCVSKISVSKEGYVQRELRLAMDIALKKPEETIYIVPLRLEECPLPDRLDKYQYLDYFPPEHRDSAYADLHESLVMRAKELGFTPNKPIFSSVALSNWLTDKQKRNERKKRIDNFITRTQKYEYERGKVQRFLETSLLELNDWHDWQPDQQEKYRAAFLELIDGVRGKGTLQEVFSDEPSLWTQPALQIAEKIRYADTELQAILEKLKQHASGYPYELCASRFPPEKYPFQKQFVQQAKPWPQTGSWGTDIWQMHFAPFDDYDNPFLYVRDNNEFPLLGSIKFPFNERRFICQTYYFQNAWDLRVGYYQYCYQYYPTLDTFADENLRALSQHTFFVPLLAEEIPPWGETVNPEEHLLHSLAATWLRLLAYNPSVTDEVNLIEVEAIGRLLVWHYGSAAAVQSLSLPSDTRIVQHLRAIRPGKTLGTGDKTGFLSLRPRGADRTLYLCAEFSPTGKSDKEVSIALPQKLEKSLEAVNTYVVRFLLAAKKEQVRALKMRDYDLQKLLDERIQLSSAGARQTFDELFFPEPPREMLTNFISRANGSPGTIIQMAHTLMERHIQQSPDTPEISPEALLE